MQPPSTVGGLVSVVNTGRKPTEGCGNRSGKPARLAERYWIGLLHQYPPRTAR
jgi:hypothetical protein